MTHEAIFEYFKIHFPQHIDEVDSWNPHDKDSIFIKRVDGRDFMFTYVDKKHWRLETLKSYIKRTEGGKGMC